jgi:hypothetical protein
MIKTFKAATNYAYKKTKSEFKFDLKFMLFLVPLVIIIPYLLPSMFWFSVYEVKVEDAFEGQSPKITVDKSIRAYFSAEWTVSVRRAEGPGYITVCENSGKSNYSPKAPRQLNVDLQWWMGTKEPCKLSPGKYVVYTHWNVNSLIDFRIWNESNEFIIKPRSN